MEVKIRLYQTSQPIVFKSATNTYQKGGMYCVYIGDENKVFKYPLEHIFNVEETYASYERRDQTKN